MDFVTITDHDSIAGVSELRDLPDILVGEEVTCYFAQDHCKIHLLVWGITQQDHDALQATADDITGVAQYVADHDLAHAVAHPLYRQNDKLDRWHIEQLLLMFRGFECLNGAHSMGHRKAFEPMLDALDAAEIRRLERLHQMSALYPRPWAKVRTAGSDDHGLLNIGRTWAEFPADTHTPQQVLQCLRDGLCRPAGEAGSSIKLAHNFYGVGIRYYTKQLADPGGSIRSAVLQRMVGDKPCRGNFALAAAGAAFKARGFLGKIGKTLGLKRRAPRGTELLAELLSSAVAQRLDRDNPLRQAISQGIAPLGEHQSLFDFLGDLNRDVAGGIFASVADAIGKGKLGAIFDSVSTVLAHQALQFPYYFALFHQNQERHLLSHLSGRPGQFNHENLRVGVFTDEADSSTAAGYFAQGLADYAETRGLELIVHDLGDASEPSTKYRRRFQPLLHQRLADGQFDLKIPPVLEILEWADRQQFDAILVNTCGPMGLCGKLVAQMLRTPLLAVTHDDLPSRILGFTGSDYRCSAAAMAYTKWFFSSVQKTMLRSRAGAEMAERLSIPKARMLHLPPTPQTRPTVAESDESFWTRLGVQKPLRLAVPGAVTERKDMQLIANAFVQVCQKNSDAALVVVGNGPWVKLLKESPVKSRIHFHDSQEIYNRADLLLFPDRNETTAQIVVDAQSAGIPVLASAKGAAQEFMDDEVTGHVLPSDDPGVWATAILRMLADDETRHRMGRIACRRAQRLIPSKAYEIALNACLQAAIDETPARLESKAPQTQMDSPTKERSNA
jgi:glycosyltransferase involved in cell wall biosynthesis